jgi:hypothetical protein
MESARLDFHRLIADATPAGLRRPSDGTRWTNRQLLFHMLFGYLVVRALLVLVRVFGLLPGGAGKAFAKLLDSAHRPFDLINYLGSCAGAWIIPPGRMTRMLDRVIAALQQRLQRETGPALRRGMHYPTTWDPFFAGYMTLAGIYHYPPSISASTSASSHSARHGDSSRAWNAKICASSRMSQLAGLS